MAWSFLDNYYLFVTSNERKIRRVNASTGSAVSQWSVPGTDSWIALSQHGKFIAHSTNKEQHHVLGHFDAYTIWSRPVQ